MSSNKFRPFSFWVAVSYYYLETATPTQGGVEKFKFININQMNTVKQL